MIRRLQKQFTIVFMTILLIVLIGLFLIVGFYNVRSLENQCHETLKYTVNTDTLSLEGRKSISSYIFMARFNLDGQKMNSSGSLSNIAISEGEFFSLSKKILNSREFYGSIPEYNLKFMVKKSIDYTTIAYYNTEDITENTRQMIFLFIFVGLIAMIFFGIVSIFLSRFCVRPVEESWNAQQKFVADASHELKTPLTVILANLSLIKRDKNKTINDNSKYLDYIQDEAGHMSNLINDMLFLAKTDATKENETKLPVSLSEVCFNSYLPFESVAYEKGITINANIEDKIEVLGIESKLEQLACVLLDNACKYTNPNGTINISLQKKGNTAILQINNSGDPIPKDQLSHLFERFFRADEARTRTESGFGLGLSIAHNIVKIHHGKIYAKSDAATGTTITIELLCNHTH